jgi:hypothetical protein
MQHISVPSSGKILYGSVSALLSFTVAAGQTGAWQGAEQALLTVLDTNHPLLLEFFAYIGTAFSTGTTISVGATPTGEDYLAASDITATTPGFYPAANANKKYHVTANAPIYVRAGGTLQVTTATGVGTVTVAGNAAVVVTAAGVTGSPITFAIPVTTGAPSVWVPEVVTYLETNAAAAALRAKYAVSGTGATIVLTALTPAANDATLNVATATGTATGITTEATSVATTAGVANPSVGSAVIYCRVTELYPEPSSSLPVV